MRVRVPFAILALSAAFGIGAASSHRMERDARAQSALQTASVYVPVEGLAFRALDGHVVARLSYDARGGTFEVYDGRERPSAALRPAPVADTPRVPAAPPSATIATVSPLSIVDLGY